MCDNLRNQITSLYLGICHNKICQYDFRSFESTLCSGLFTELGIEPRGALVLSYIPSPLKTFYFLR